MTSLAKLQHLPSTLADFLSNCFTETGRKGDMKRKEGESSISGDTIQLLDCTAMKLYSNLCDKNVHLL